VNDGSTDETSEIAHRYATEFPNIVRVFDKDNSGHGSGINTAVVISVGKFFKAVDADDRIENVTEYLDALEKSAADIVLTNFRTVTPSDILIREYKANGNDNHDVLNFHGVTYRTDFYRDLNFQLPENVSYEDSEYSTVPFAYTDKIEYFDIFVYVYTLGRVGQSMSAEIRTKRLHDYEVVIYDTLQYLPDNAVKRNFFLWKLGEMLLSSYSAAMIISPDKRSGRKYSRELCRRIRYDCPDLYNVSRKRYLACVIMSYLRFNGDTLQNIKKLPVYKVIRKVTGN
jgi:glycosyltransferase involved in cell wall biosynthesis